MAPLPCDTSPKLTLWKANVVEKVSQAQTRVQLNTCVLHQEFPGQCSQNPPRSLFLDLGKVKIRCNWGWEEEG